MHCQKVLRQYCEEHGRKELGDERFDVLLSVRHCKEIGCESYPVKAGYCVVHARLRLGLVDQQVVMTKPKKRKDCREPGCQKQQNIKSLCVFHARQNLDAATFQSLYHALKGCKEPGCKKLLVMKNLCLSHARQRLEPHVFEQLYGPLKECKDSGCKKKVGVRGRDGFCEMHKLQPSVMASMSRGDHANATVSGETTDIRKGGSSDSDDDSTVTTASKGIRAPMDTSNSDEHPIEKENNENKKENEKENEKEEVARGEGERECCGSMRGKHAKLEIEYEKLKGENEKLRLLLAKRDEESQVGGVGCD